MTLITIFLALALDRLVGFKPSLHDLSWFDRYRMRVSSILPTFLQRGIVAVIVLLLPIVMLLLGIQYLISAWYFGVPELILSVIVLYYTLSSAELSEHIEAYLDARKNDEPQKASSEAATLAGGSCLNERYAESTAVTMSIMHRSAVDIFCVIFWFVLLGPVGALLYRLSYYLSGASYDASFQNLSAAADRVLGLLGWIPFRLVALTYFLAGSFDDALEGWKVGHMFSWDFSKSNCLVVTLTGCGAIRHEVDDAVDEKPDPGNNDLEWVHTARHLIVRSVVVWYGVIAMLTLTTGWLH